MRCASARPSIRLTSVALPAISPEPLRCCNPPRRSTDRCPPTFRKSRRDIQAEINDGRLRSLRQKEEQDWQNAKKDVDAGRFSSAEKYLASILALPEGGLRKDDARKYQDQVIPQRKQEETLWAQAKKDSQKNDLGSLKQADNTLGPGHPAQRPQKIGGRAVAPDGRRQGGKPGAAATA